MRPPNSIAARVLLSPEGEVLAHVFSSDAGVVTMWHEDPPRIEIVQTDSQWRRLHLSVGRHIAAVKSLGLGIIVHDPTSARYPP